MPLFTNSGGLIYHVRAFRDVERQWRPFRKANGAWLEEWQPGSEGLLIVGPSGGYSLQTEWLAQFAGVVAIDFDPLAERIFRRRHRGCRIERWIQEDVFPTTAQGLDLAPLQRRMEEYPNHAVLFSNVLGQIALNAPNEDAVEADFVPLRRLLDGRSWASYHDRLSAPRRPELPSDRRHRNDPELAGEAYGSGEVFSHSTGLFGQGLECATFAWECQRGYWNLIEGCRGSG